MIFATNYKKCRKTLEEQITVAARRIKAAYDKNVNPEVLYEACKEESPFVDDRHQVRTLVLLVELVS